jgi:hypothetical protein
MIARAALDRGAENLVDALVASGNVVAGLSGEHRTAVTREYALFELER